MQPNIRTMRITSCAVFASLILVLFAGAVPTADANTTCSTAESVPPNSTRSDRVTYIGDQRWYRHIAEGPVSYTLTVTGTEEVAFKVYADNCSTILCAQQETDWTGTASCTIPSGTYFRVMVYYWGGDATYSMTFAGQIVPECKDSVDNDADGHVDYPADPGCGSSNDAREGASCSPVASSVVACLEAGAPWLSFSAYDGQGPDSQVAGYVDLYQFMLPGGISTSLFCVVLLFDGARVDPCAEAGGTASSRILTIVDDDVSEPAPQQGNVLQTVRICHAELIVTVLGAGVNSAPAYTVC